MKLFNIIIEIQNNNITKFQSRLQDKRVEGENFYSTLHVFYSNYAV